MKPPNKTFLIFINVIFTAGNGGNFGQIAISEYKTKKYLWFFNKNT